MKLLGITAVLVLLGTSGVRTQTETTSETPTTTVAPNKYVCTVRDRCYKPEDSIHWYLCVDGQAARAEELTDEADAILKKRCPEMYSGSKFLGEYVPMMLLTTSFLISLQKKLPFVALLTKSLIWTKVSRWPNNCSGDVKHVLKTC